MGQMGGLDLSVLRGVYVCTCVCVQTICVYVLCVVQCHVVVVGGGQAGWSE